MIQPEDHSNREARVDKMEKSCPTLPFGKRIKPCVLFPSEQSDDDTEESHVLPTKKLRISYDLKSVKTYDWIFDACAKVRDGIAADVKKLSNAVQSERSEFCFYKATCYSQKRFREFEDKIFCMEFDLWHFPTEVIKEMCLDMTAVIDKSDGSALKFLRAKGTHGIDEDLMTKFMRNWKTSLYRRGVWEYLMLHGEEHRWEALLLGNELERMWLAEKFNDVTGEEMVEIDRADFIVEMLFPWKAVTSMISSPADDGNGTPQSVDKEWDDLSRLMLESDM